MYFGEKLTIKNIGARIFPPALGFNMAQHSYVTVPVNIKCLYFIHHGVLALIWI